MGRKAKEYQHGEYGMYTYRKCRCDECRSIAAKVRMKYRGEDFEQQTEDVMFRLPAAPLMAYIERTGQEEAVSRHVVRRWLIGGIDIYKADEWAIRLGTHPFLLWGAEFYQQRQGSVLEEA